MHLTFDPNLAYRQTAVQSVAGLFEGHLFNDGLLQPDSTLHGSLFGAFGDSLQISSEQIPKKLQNIKIENGTAVSNILEGL